MGKMCGIHRVEKRKRQALGGLQAEACRSADHPIELAGSDIDWSRTEENQYLKFSEDWYGSIKSRLLDAGVSKTRKDAVMALDGLYTASADFFKDMSRHDVMQYFRDCLEWHIKTYCHGDDTLLVSAVVHFDETTPHMQVLSIPLTDDDKLSAKTVMGGRADYHARQDAFYEDVSSRWGLERGEVRDHADAKKHRDQMLWKAEQAEELARQAEDRVRQARTEELSAQLDIDDMRSQRDALTSQLDALDDCISDIEELTQQVRDSKAEHERRMKAISKRLERLDKDTREALLKPLQEAVSCQRDADQAVQAEVQALKSKRVNVLAELSRLQRLQKSSDAEKSLKHSRDDLER